MRWNKACTILCAELGKQEILFPEKSSYIRFWVKRDRDNPKHPTIVGFLPWILGSRFPCSWALTSCLLTLKPP